MARRCYVLLRRCYDVPIRRRRDAPLRRFGDVPWRRCWVFHLRRTCDVTGTYRETSLRRRHDVLMPGGKYDITTTNNLLTHAFERSKLQKRGKKIKGTGKKLKKRSTREE